MGLSHRAPGQTPRVGSTPFLQRWRRKSRGAQYSQRVCPRPWGQESGGHGAVLTSASGRVAFCNLEDLCKRATRVLKKNEPESYKFIRFHAKRMENSWASPAVNSLFPLPSSREPGLLTPRCEGQALVVVFVCLPCALGTESRDPSSVRIHIFSANLYTAGLVSFTQSGPFLFSCSFLEV